MANGKLIADTIQHSTAGTVSTEAVVKGSANSLLNFQNSGSNVTHRSLNISSVVDDDIGVMNVNFTVNYNAADYIMTAAAYTGGSGASTNPALAMSTYSGAQAYATSGCGVMAEDVDAGNLDYTNNFMNFFGDLA